MQRVLLFALPAASFIFARQADGAPQVVVKPDGSVKSISPERKSKPVVRRVAHSEGAEMSTKHVAKRVALADGPPISANGKCFFDGGSLLSASADHSDIAVKELEKGAILAEQDLHTLAVQSDFVHALKMLPPITKKIHVKWPYKNVTDSKSNMVKYGLRQAIDLNPDWDYQVWSDHEVDQYLEGHLSTVDWQNVKDTGFAEKSDIWRLVLLYCEGGFYQDMDRIYNIPMASLLAPETKMLLPMGPADFAQDLMCSSPGNPIFKEAVHLNLARRRASGTTADPGRVLRLGPLTYYNAVTKLMFGVMLERGNTRDHTQQNRVYDLIEEGVSPIIVTKKETWCHLIVAEMPDCKWVGRTGLYKEYGITIWTEEEKARHNHALSPK